MRSSQLWGLLVGLPLEVNDTLIILHQRAAATGISLMMARVQGHTNKKAPDNRQGLYDHEEYVSILSRSSL